MGRLAPFSIYGDRMPKVGQYPNRLVIYLSDKQHIGLTRLCEENNISKTGWVRMVIGMAIREEESISYPKKGKQ